VGGGIRSIERANEYISAGAERVIFGTAVMEMRIVIDALKSFGSACIMASVDHIMGRVAVKGWKELTDIDAAVLCKRLEETGVTNIIMTSIDRDGTMKGPSLNYSLEVARDLKADVYVAGGFAVIQDLQLLKGSRVAGVILGKSLYQGTINLKKALEMMG
jgi:phosphoribosylformimino-5-aminoimidazole carboxamide ribotide isomerase